MIGASKISYIALTILILSIGFILGTLATSAKTITIVETESFFKTFTETLWRTVERTKVIKLTETETRLETLTRETIETVTTTITPGILPPPSETGHAELGGNTEFTIINDSPYDLLFTFKGPESKEIPIERCETCKVYSFIGPVFCPTEGRPEKTFTLKAGTYTVNAITPEDTDVIPFYGIWDGKPDTRYSYCFYVVRKMG